MSLIGDIVTYDLCNSFRDLKNILREKRHGKRCIAKINGTWSVVRSKHISDNGNLTILYGPLQHELVVPKKDWKDRSFCGYSEQGVLEDVISRNLEGLRSDKKVFNEPPEPEPLPDEDEMNEDLDFDIEDGEVEMDINHINELLRDLQVPQIPVPAETPPAQTPA